MNQVSSVDNKASQKKAVKLIYFISEFSPLTKEFDAYLRAFYVALGLSKNKDKIDKTFGDRQKSKADYFKSEFFDNWAN